MMPDRTMNSTAIARPRNPGLGERSSVFRPLLLTAAAALLAAPPAFADAPPRVRGVVTGVDNDSMTVKERNGSVVTLKTSAGPSYAYVVPSSLDAIKVNDFVGT